MGKTKISCFYRLQQLGKTTVSKCHAILHKHHQKVVEAKFFPNPVGYLCNSLVFVTSTCAACNSLNHYVSCCCDKLLLLKLLPQVK